MQSSDRGIANEELVSIDYPCPGQGESGVTM